MRRLAIDVSHRLTFVFAAVLVPAAAALVWLGVQLLEQDRTLWAQREIERQEAVADAIVRALAQKLADAEQQLADGRPLDGTVLITWSGDRVVVQPAALAAWNPFVASPPNRVDRPFEIVENTIEYRPGGSRTALDTYRRLANSADPAVRAGALMRIARVQRRDGRVDAALTAYREAATLTAASVFGMPADLAARRATCRLYFEMGRTGALRDEAALLERDVLVGRWQPAVLQCPAMDARRPQPHRPEAGCRQS